MKFAGFEWDSANREKCLKHGVSIEEIEGLFGRSVVLLPDRAHSTTEERLLAIARSKTGRHVFLVFTIRKRGEKRYIRPISARYMHKKEIDAYEKENPKL